MQKGRPVKTGYTVVVNSQTTTLQYLPMCVVIFSDPVRAVGRVLAPAGGAAAGPAPRGHRAARHLRIRRDQLRQHRQQDPGGCNSRTQLHGFTDFENM